MSAKTILQRGFARILSDYTSTIIKNGIRKNCLASEVIGTQEMMDAGFSPGYSLTAELSVADFKALGIKEREDVTIDGKQMIVVGINEDATDPCVRIALTAVK